MLFSMIYPLTNQGPALNFQQVFNQVKYKAKVITQLALILLGGISLFINIKISLICFIGSVAFLMFPRAKVTDYSKPMIPIYQMEASLSPIDDTIEQHGWVNMIKYDIPKRAGLISKLEEKFASMTIEKCLEFIRTIPSKSTDYSFLRKNWAKEMKHMSVCEVLEKYDIDQLVQYKIADTPLKRAEVEYLKQKALLNQGLVQIEKDFNSGKLSELERNQQKQNYSTAFKKACTKINAQYTMQLKP